MDSNKNTKVAIIDTGIDINDLILKNKRIMGVVLNWKFYLLTT